MATPTAGKVAHTALADPGHARRILRPLGIATRAQTAAMVVRLLR